MLDREMLKTEAVQKEPDVKRVREGADAWREWGGWRERSWGGRRGRAGWG